MAEDRKFKFEDGRFVNRVSGEAIPDDEPVIIFRARDRHALQVLYHYQQLCTDEHHQRAIEDRIQEFQAFRDTHPLKEPGVTRHIVLNSELGEAATAGKSGEDAPSQHADARPYPDLLSPDEAKALLKLAEDLWRDLQDNNLGGFSYGNRPFYVLYEFKKVIETFGRRDVGLTWSKNDLDAALALGAGER